MAIPDLIRSLIAGPVVGIAGPLRTSVLLYRVVSGHDEYGPAHDTVPIEHEALVEEISENVAGQDGTIKVSSTKFTFFSHVDVAEGDIIELSGVQSTIIKVGGLLDERAQKYITEVWTGKQ